MVLIKLDKLSESELRSIAEQEGIEGFGDLSLAELIIALSEKYDEDDVAIDESNEAPNTRYVSGITDYRPIDGSVEGLPGVEELPESYEETSIHLLNKNVNWGYAYWSISQIDAEKLEERDEKTELMVFIEKRDGSKEEYGIEITSLDKEWNIGFPSDAASCRVSLMAVSKSGAKRTLTSSNVIKRLSCYWLEHVDEMKSSDGLFKVYLSFLTNKQGDLIRNDVVREIVMKYLEVAGE